MMCNLLGAVWLLCCTLSLGVVQAARTMQTKTIPRDSFIQVGSLLKLATWNCGGLSFMQREMCRDLDYDLLDLLDLTETHDKGTLQRKKDFICSDIAPQNDPFSGVALLLSNRLSKCVLNSSSNSSRVVFARIRADPCNTLLLKLKCLGIEGKLLNTIKDFLTNRTFRVCVEGQFFSTKEVLSGFPQGSVLGPLLFVLYINDLPDYVENKAELFADDLELIANAANWKIIDDDLWKLEQWEQTCLLEFNLDKCKVMHLEFNNN